MQTLKHLLERLKKYKWLILAAGVIALFLLILLTSEKYGFSPQTPNKTPQETPPRSDILLLMHATPPSEIPRQIADGAEYIQLEFSTAIDISEIQVAVSPYMKLETRVFKDRPNILWLIPNKAFWKPQTKYRITVTGVKGLSGETLIEAVKYTYYNDPPTNIEYSGENVFIP